MKKTSNMDIVIKFASFRDWLETNRDKVIGETASYCKCPVANYLKFLGYKDVRVWAEIAHWKAEDGSYSEYCLDYWTKAFICRVDRLSEKSIEIMGGTALRFLDTVK